MAFKKPCLAFAGFIGFILAIISTIALLYFPDIISKKIKEKVPLVHGSESMDRWLKVKVPITMSFTIFEVINPTEVASGSAQPIVVERGPYVFDETRHKIVTGSDEESGSISYNQFKTYIFNRNKSVGSLDDEYSIPNVPAIVLSTLIAKKKTTGTIKQLIMPILDNLMVISNQQLFIKKKVREILFDGYQISFVHELIQQLKTFGVSIQLQDNFGFFLNKNGTHDGEYTVHNGLLDINRFTKIEKWSDKSKVNFWEPGSFCNDINGTDGSQFNPGVKRTDVLYIFSSELCRSIYIEYEKDTEIRGINTLKFILPKRLFLSPDRNPENGCFCLDKNEPLCGYDGIMDASPCKKGAPIVLSSPHFYNGDKRLLNGVKGLNPDKKKHETYLNIEPNTGLVFDATQRLQINVVIRPHTGIGLLRNVKDVVLPVLWLQESATVDEFSANKFKSQVTKTIVVGNSILIAFIFVGIVLILIAVAYIIWRHTSFPPQGYGHPMDKS